MEEYRVLETIRKHAQGLALQPIERIGSGQNNDIWIIDSAFIFRFPKYAEGIKQLEKEAKLLKRIADRLPLEVPRPEYCVLEPASAQAFMGYRRIDGVPLEAEQLERLKDAATLDRIAGQLAGFLKAPHGTDMGCWPDLSTSQYDPFHEWKGKQRFGQLGISLIKLKFTVHIITRLLLTRIRAPGLRVVFDVVIVTSCFFWPHPTVAPSASLTKRSGINTREP